jgi:hypothetical protein
MGDRIKDPEARATKYEMADKYDRLAARAAAWMNRNGVPRFVKSPPTAPWNSGQAK